MTYARAFFLEAARIEALTTAGQPTWTQSWSQHYSLMRLNGKPIGRQTASPRLCIRMRSVMFKITQNTICRLSFAQLLIMMAINEIEAKRMLPQPGGGVKEPVTS
jgi:hypothetical protein